MFAFKPRIDVVIRIALIVVMLFSGLVPAVSAKADTFSKENELETTISVSVHIGKMMGGIQAFLREMMNSDARSNLPALYQADSPTTTPTPIPSATDSETSSSFEGEITLTPELQATPTEQIPTETPTAFSPSVDSSSDTGIITTEISSFSTWGGGMGSSTPQNGANILQYDNPYPDLFTGRVSYSLPIWTPPGRNGMAPTLNLTYSSVTANGVLSSRS